MTPLLRLALVVAAPAALCGCGPQAAAPPPPPKAENPGPPLTPNPMPPNFFGRWAASAELCATGAWVFTDKGLTTAGEVGCDFTQLTPNETGWIAEGSCVAQGPAKAASLVLNTTRTGAERTLAVSGGPFAKPQVLIACDPAAIPPAPGAVNPGPPTGRLDEAAAIDAHIAAQAAVTGSGVRPFAFKLKTVTARAWSENREIIKITETQPAQGAAAATERQFYFRAGEPDPFLVRDAQGAYSFQVGALERLFSPQGAELPLPPTAAKAALENQLLARARELRAAARG